MSEQLTADGDTSVEQWVQAMADRAASEDNQLLGEVAENLEYFLTHTDEWENGDFHYTDLPNLKKQNRWMMYRAVNFGLMWAAERSRLYAVADADGGFVGLYGEEANARDRAADATGYTVAPIEPEAVPATDSLEPLEEAEGSGPQQVAECLRYIYDRADQWDAGDLRPDDLPNFEEDTRWLICYSVLFGTLWEWSYPGLWGIMHDDALEELHHGPSAEGRAAELGDGYYTVRMTVVDGEAGPADQIPEFGGRDDV